MNTTNPLWISKLGFESLLPSQNEGRRIGAGPCVQQRNGDTTMKRPATLVDWAFAPPWLTVLQAAHLTGYDAAGIMELIEAGAVDAEQDAGGAWLIDRASLRECQDTLRDLQEGPGDVQE